MGDSFVSGPAIDPPQKKSGVCLRSERNYPQLLAKELDISELVDVSCAGAATVHLMTDIPVTSKPGAKVPAQTKALNGKTDLVTVGIGYNNDAIFPKLLASCLPSGQKSAAKPGNCQELADDVVKDLHQRVRDDIVDALKATRREAPNATIVLVGYLPLLPEPDACPEGVFMRDNQQSTYDVEVAVDDTLRSAAEAAGTEFVSMRDAGRGHGMCAGADAWVNGLKVAAGDGVIVHPRAVGMQAVADAVAAQLKSSGR
jgi:lysophospholipase L1-like esterase